MINWFTKRRPGQPEKKKMTSEIAAAASDVYEPLAGYLGTRPNRDPLLASQQPGDGYMYPYGLFEEALDKDAHLSSLVSQRKAAVLSWSWSVVADDDSPDAAAAKELVERAIESISSAGESGGGSFERDLSELLDAIPYGYAVSEIIWRRAGGNGNSAGLLLPVALKSRHPRRFTFDTGGRLRLLTAAEPVAGEPVPERKFLVFAPYGRHESPYGLPALRSVWWLTWFKRQVLKFWVMYAEKYGTPVTVLKHPLAATDREKQAYRRIIASIQQETGLVVPEGVEFELLDGQGAGGAGTYRELTEFCNAEMSKAIVGQTLTTEQGERGARSLGEVHLTVREDIVRQDAQALMGLVNGQLVRWLVELNLPPEKRRYPRWQLTPPREEDLALQLDIDEFFASQGLPLDRAELYARYGRGLPELEEESGDE